MAKYLDAQGVQYLVALLKKYVEGLVPDFTDVYANGLLFGPSSTELAASGKSASQTGGCTIYTQLTRSGSSALNGNVTIPVATATKYGVVTENQIKTIINNVIQDYVPPAEFLKVDSDLIFNLTGYTYTGKISVTLKYGSNEQTFTGISKSGGVWTIPAATLTGAFKGTLSVPATGYEGTSLQITQVKVETSVAGYSLSAKASIDTSVSLSDLVRTSQTKNYVFSPVQLEPQAGYTIRVNKYTSTNIGSMNVEFKVGSTTAYRNNISMTGTGTSVSKTFNKDDMRSIFSELGMNVAAAITVTVKQSGGDSGLIIATQEGSSGTYTLSVADVNNMLGGTAVTKDVYHARVWASASSVSLAQSGDSTGKTVDIYYSYATFRYSTDGSLTTSSLTTDIRVSGLSDTMGNTNGTGSVRLTFSKSSANTGTSPLTGTLDITSTPSGAIPANASSLHVLSISASQEASEVKYPLVFIGEGTEVKSRYPAVGIDLEHDGIGNQSPGHRTYTGLTINRWYIMNEVAYKEFTSGGIDLRLEIDVRPVAGSWEGAMTLTPDVSNKTHINIAKNGLVTGEANLSRNDIHSPGYGENTLNITIRPVDDAVEVQRMTTYSNGIPLYGFPIEIVITFEEEMLMNRTIGTGWSSIAELDLYLDATGSAINWGAIGPEFGDTVGLPGGAGVYPIVAGLH